MGSQYDIARDGRILINTVLDAAATPDHASAELEAAGEAIQAFASQYDSTAFSPTPIPIDGLRIHERVFSNAQAA